MILFLLPRRFYDFRPNIILLEIGSNDLCNPAIQPDNLADHIRELVTFLHFNYQVDHIIVNEVLPRLQPQAVVSLYNHRITSLNRSLRRTLRLLPFITFWSPWDLLNDRDSVYLRDGVHLNRKGNYLLYRSYQRILQRLLSRPRDRTPSNRGPSSHKAVRRRPCRQDRAPSS